MGAPPIVQANKQQLLGLIQTACNELGIRKPSQIFGATDNQTIQLLALANREGKDFYNKAMRINGWQELRQANIFNLRAAISTLTGTVSLSVPQITAISSNTNVLSVGMAVTGSGIQNDTHILTIDSSSQITLDQQPTIAGTAVALSFGTDRYAMPNDFAYYMATTSWDRSFRWQLLGPLEAQEWQVLKSGISPTGPRRRFRIMGNYWYVDPVPTAVETVVFEYYSNSWCQSSAGVAQNKWVADTDYYSLDDEAFILGLKWRFLAAKKLDYTQEESTYKLLVERLMARNGANRDLPLNAQASGIRLLNEQNVPDTGYGS